MNPFSSITTLSFSTLPSGSATNVGDTTTVISRGLSSGHIGAICCGIGLYTAPSSRLSGRAWKGGISPVFAGTVTTAPEASVTVVVAGLLLPVILPMKNWTAKKMASPCRADFSTGYSNHQHNLNSCRRNTYTKTASISLSCSPRRRRGCWLWHLKDIDEPSSLVED